MTCMCGATDCPSCGPDQGYNVVRVYNYKTRDWEYVNPEDDEQEKQESDGR